MSGIHILYSEQRGINIPRDFISDNFPEVEKVWKISKQDIEAVLEGPDGEDYWDAWAEICGNAEFTDGNGNKWNLYQDGDLFIYCRELMTTEEYKDFFGEDKPEYL